MVRDNVWVEDGIAEGNRRRQGRSYDRTIGSVPGRGRNAPGANRVSRVRAMWAEVASGRGSAERRGSRRRERNGSAMTAEEFEEALARFSSSARGVSGVRVGERGRATKRDRRRSRTFHAGAAEALAPQRTGSRRGAERLYRLREAALEAPCPGWPTADEPRTRSPERWSSAVSRCPRAALGAAAGLTDYVDATSWAPRGDAASPLQRPAVRAAEREKGRTKPNLTRPRSRAAQSRTENMDPTLSEAMKTAVPCG